MRDNTYVTREIVQIMPAGGWVAVYATDDGFNMVPIVAWALLDHVDRNCRTDKPTGKQTLRLVEGIAEFGRDGVDFVEEMSNWIGYAPNHSPSAEGRERWEESAQEQRDEAARLSDQNGGRSSSPTTSGATDDAPAS